MLQTLTLLSMGLLVGMIVPLAIKFARGKAGEDKKRDLKLLIAATIILATLASLAYTCLWTSH